MSVPIAAPPGARQFGGAAAPRIAAAFLRLMLPFAALIATLAWWDGSRSVDTMIDERLDEASHDAHAGSMLFLRVLDAPLHHIASLAGEAEVRAAFIDGDQASLQSAGRAFATLLQRNPDYDQVRWIDQSGRERLRYYRSPDGPRRMPDADLQDESGRNYFRDAMKVPPGMIYLSPIDLNVEQGRVELPHKPLLRVAQRIQGDTGDNRGILVINVLAKSMLDAAMLATGESDERFMLINGGGYYLRAPDSGDEWAFMFNRPITLEHHSPGLWARMRARADGKYIDAAGLWSWHSIVPPAATHAGAADTPWRTVIHVPGAELADRRREIWQGVAAHALLALGLAAALCLAAAWRRIERDAALLAAGRAHAEASAAVERMASQQKLHELAELLGNIVSSTDDAIISTTPDGRVTSWNAGAQRLYGHASSEMLGQPLERLFAPGTHAAELAALEQVAHGSTLHGFVTVNRTKDGTLIDIAATISPLRNANGHIVGAARIARDITQEKLLAHELQTHRDHLEELVQSRTQALAAANRDIEKRERFIRTVTDHMPGTVSYWDRNLHCRFANRAHQEWLGLHPDAMLGRRMSELFAGPLYDTLADPVRSGLQGRATRIEYTIERQDGSVVHALMDVVADQCDETTQGVYVLATDITAVKQAELKMRHANVGLTAALARADAATAAKSAFLATMSHEIRTPMTGILGIAHLIERQALPAEARALATRLSGAGRSLLRIINDILDFSKVEAGKLELEQADFSVQDLIDDVASIVATLPGKKPVTLLFDPVPAGVATLCGDSLRLRQVLVNLLSNAIKFTAAGQVRLGMRAETAAEGRVRMHFSVRDSGPGIAPERQAHLFKPYEQENVSTARAYGGSGLGLAICRQLVDLMGGRIGLNSALGAGSEFWFSVELPLAPKPEAPKGAGQHLSMLVVASDAAVRDTLAHIVELGGCHASLAADAASAQQQLYAARRELIVIDSAHKLDQALALARNLRAHPTGGSARIVLLATADERDRLLASGVEQSIDAVLARPVTLTALAGAAAHLCRRPDHAPLAADKVQPVVHSPLAGLRVLVVDDTEINCDVARGILEAEGAKVTTASGGQQALEFLQT
ncbi:MAG: PAS domain S-box protein, partial [Rhodocyclaceae bacterium]|nr:PAS domain S-box protein [Rhodocyclaceae bacterium]